MIENKDLEVVSEVGRDDTREDNPKSDESNEDIPQTVSKFSINSSRCFNPITNGGGGL